MAFIELDRCKGCEALNGIPCPILSGTGDILWVNGILLFIARGAGLMKMIKAIDCRGYDERQGQSLAVQANPAF